MVNLAATPLKGAQCVTLSVMQTESSPVAWTLTHRFASKGSGAIKHCKCLFLLVKVCASIYNTVLCPMEYVHVGMSNDRYYS